jgi:hypothetical protein
MCKQSRNRGEGNDMKAITGNRVIRVEKMEYRTSVKRHQALLIILLFALSFTLPSVVFSQESTMKEYPYLYKSTRAMGMGGAYTAIGGKVDTLFYNPAGLSAMKQDKGWEVNLINLSVEAGEDIRDFSDDMQDALDTKDLNGDGDDSDDQLRAVNDILAKYRGKNLHVRVADFTSLGKNSEKIAFGLGGLASFKADMMTHQGFGPEGFLDVNADATYGGIGGVSIKVMDGLFGGFSVKALHRESLVHVFTSRELVAHEDDLDEYIKKELKVSGSGIGFDAGMLYQFARDSWLKPSAGISVMNIGDMKFGDAGKIPMTVNAGIAVNPSVPVFKALTIGLDYVDILNNFEQDSDKGKRLRLGGELQLFDAAAAAMAIRAGLYQGYPTFGADLRLLIFSLSYVIYAEEVGAYAGQDKDRRHLLTLNIGW